MMRLGYISLLTYMMPLFLKGQQIQMRSQGTLTSLRGLSVVSDQVIWVCGSNGQVGRSVNGGHQWEWFTVAGFAQTDFRDVEGFNETTALIMGVGSPGYLLYTRDGGRNWQPVFVDTAKGVFFDAMDFQGKEGILVGDPLPHQSKPYILLTHDKGLTWEKWDALTANLADGEAFFAASGSNVVIPPMKKNRSRKWAAYLVTGGKKSSFISLLDTTTTIPIPMPQGKTSTGANALALRNATTLVVCGGDFLLDKDTTANCWLSFDAGYSWIRPSIPPGGYRSSVTYLSRKKILTCGTSGVDISFDGGMQWQGISKDSYHVCRKAKKGKKVFLAGAGGRIAELIF